jgi:hypothetical protein
MTDAITEANHKDLAIEHLNHVLFNLTQENVEWPESTRIGFADRTDGRLEEDIRAPQFGKVAHADFVELLVHGGYSVIVYSAGGFIGYAVLNKNEMVCMPLTSHALIDWLMPGWISPWDAATTQRINKLIDDTDGLTPIE